PDNGFQITGLAKHGQLLIGARALTQHRVDVPHGLAALQLIDHIVHELQKLDGQLAHRNFRALAKVDQLAVNSPTSGTPLVFLDECSPIEPESQVARIELMQLHDDGLRKPAKHHRRLWPSRDITNAEFQRSEGRVRTHVPPDLFRIIDTMQL